MVGTNTNNISKEEIVIEQKASFIKGANCSTIRNSVYWNAWKSSCQLFGREKHSWHPTSISNRKNNMWTKLFYYTIYTDIKVQTICYTLSEVEVCYSLPFWRHQKRLLQICQHRHPLEYQQLLMDVCLWTDQEKQKLRQGPKQDNKRGITELSEIIDLNNSWQLSYISKVSLKQFTVSNW